MAEHLYADEEWRQIPECPNYSVSNYSRIRRDVPPVRPGSKAKAGMILKPEIGKHGHPRIRIMHNGTYYRFLTYRLAAVAFNLPKRDDQNEIAHCDGNPRNNHISNLRWATRKENAADTLVHGTAPIGERNVQSRRCGLTAEKVRAIRRMKADGALSAAIEQQFGLKRVTIDAIISRRSWKYLE